MRGAESRTTPGSYSTSGKGVGIKMDTCQLKPLIDLPRMAEKTEEMLDRSLDAFINRDAEAARQIAAEDSIVLIG